MTDFSQEALEFVRKNNCAGYITVQLVQKAMEEGAVIATQDATNKLKKVNEDLELQRSKNTTG